MLRMLTKNESSGAKRTGKRPYFPVRVEDEICRLYFDDDLTAAEISRRFSPISPSGSVSASAIRAIARKALRRRHAADQPEAA